MGFSWMLPLGFQPRLQTQRQLLPSPELRLQHVLPILIFVEEAIVEDVPSGAPAAQVPEPLQLGGG